MLNTIFSADVQLTEMLIMMAAAIALGILNSMVFTYKSNFTGSMALTLAVMPLAEAVIIFLVNGNVGVGVAVAGSFALVRFRSVAGTAKEIAGIFVDMALGLILGMGYIGLAVIFFALSAVLVLVLTLTGFGTAVNEKRLKITIPENLNYTGLFDEVFSKYTESCRLVEVKTKNMGTLYELSYDVKFAKDEIPKEFIDELRTRNGNLNISIGMLPDKNVL